MRTSAAKAPAAEAPALDTGPARSGGPQLTTWFTDRIWEGLGQTISPTDRLTTTGDGDLRTPFPVLDMAAAAFAVNGRAVSQLLQTAGFDPVDVQVDRCHAGAWFDVPIAPTRFQDTVEPHGVHARWMAEFQTSDDRWVRVQASFPTLRRRMCQALGVDPEPDQVARAIRALPADEVETRLIAAGAVAAVGRSLIEWRTSAQGRAVATEPIAAIQPTLTRTPTWSPHPDRPLLGLRVLDMTRVVAGPMATRLLAALGAEVLRIDPPHGDEAAMMGISDIVLGKRWALLDARSEEGRDRYRELLASADVFIHGYRPGTIDSLGFDEAARAEVSPGLVEVTLDAFGWSGPRRHERGFDTIVQFASGLAHDYARWAGEAPELRLPMSSLGQLVDASRPRILPVEVLDFATGYQVAAAAITGLTRQLATGYGSVSKLSIARTSALLTQPTFTFGGLDVGLPVDVPLTGPVREMNRRPARRIQFPVRIGDLELFWDRPAELPGSSAPQWSTQQRS